MEPLACTVDLKSVGCELYYASQMQGIDASAVASVTGVAADKVNINVQMGGAGFGRRAVPTVDTWWSRSMRLRPWPLLANVRLSR